jgi:carboxyl-terminal processing protease
MSPKTPRRTVALALAAVAVLLVAALPAAAQEPDASPVPSVAPSLSPLAAPSPAPSGAPSVTPDACVEPEASLEPVSEEALSMPEDFRIALFNGVWEGIRDLYVDPETNGLDWEAIGDEYAPLVIATDNAHEVYQLLGEMVGLLDDPFTSYFAPEELGDPAAFDPSYGGIGALLDTSAAGEDSSGLRIVYVFDGSSAQEAGIRARDSIVGVEGDACARIADIRGPEGTPVTLTIVSPGQEPREVTLERRRIDPRILPEVRRLEADPGVGYLRVLALSGQEAIDGIEQALTTLLRDDPLEGLILDLRASDQGAPAVVIETLRTFVEGSVGEFHSRLGNQPIEIEPNDLAEAYADIPLVVLVDEETEADAEQLAAILQDQGRALVVGAQTSGRTHGTTGVDFADGSRLQVVAFGFQLPDGETLEGVGVTPDVAVEADWLSYPESADPFLLAALESIESGRADPVLRSPAPPSVAPSPAVAPTPSIAPAASPSADPAAPPSPEPAASPAG